MKVSVKWIERINNLYGCSSNPMPKGIDDLVEKIGRQLGAVEEVEDIGKKYEGIVIAKVVECQKHPNADKLSVCLIDDGKANKQIKRNKDGLIEVVCGAPNVAKGQLVAWIPPGATVPSTYGKEPFVLEAKELRGVISNGMIASLKELGIGDDHNGIVVIDMPAKPGQSFAKVYELDDYIIDIENKMFTHRPDLFGILGVAREVAGIQGHSFKSPDFYKEKASLPKPKGVGLSLKVRNELPKQVPRFTVVAIRDINVGPSPVWLQSYLSRVGIRPINNVVDFTNFYMHATAQPLHAYDYDKVGSTIQVRKPNANETLKLLGGKTIKLRPEDVVIASADKAIGLGGVMGGAETEVDDSTKNIILECANFEMTTIRKSAMEHGLFTDAATRFTKGQSPRQNMAILTQVANMLMHPSLAGGRLASPVFDIKNFNAKPSIVSLTADFINSRLGLKFSASQIKRLLENVEFKVSIAGQKMKVEAPFWRTDIEIAEDIVEEVGRLHGYDHLNLELPERDSKATVRNAKLDLKHFIRYNLAAAGASEVQTYSFVHQSLLEKVGQSPKHSYHIRNALSPDLQYYRQTLAPNLLEKVHPNIKASFDNFVLYEMGKSYFKGVLDGNKLPAEFETLAIVTADKTSANGYFTAKNYAAYMLGRLGFKNLSYQPLREADIKKPQAIAYYEPGRSALISDGDEMVGTVGEPTQAVRRALKLPAGVGIVELDLNKIDQIYQPMVYEPINRFPSLDQDLTLKADESVSYQALTGFIQRYLGNAAAKHGISFTITPLDIYQKSAGQPKQTTWRLSFEHSQRTLTTQEINSLLDELAAAAKKELKADRI